MSVDDTVIAAAAKAIEESPSIALACHVGPDGDALGSMLALATAAAERGKDVSAGFGSPYVVPPSLSFLPTELLVEPTGFPEAPPLMVVLDVGSPERLGELAANAEKAGKVIVVDHHVTNEGFGDISVVDPQAGATGELVYDILAALGWELNPQVAMCLHTALVTDTGRFSYANTTPRTLRIAADLVAAGAEPSLIGRHVYEEAPFGYLKAAGVALGRARLDREKKVVSTVLTHEDLEESEIGWDDTENLIDLLRLTLEADTAVLVKAHEDGRVKVSLRSRGDTDVGSLALSMGGGGHRLAAGFTADGDPEAVRERVVSAVGEYR